MALISEMKKLPESEGREQDALVVTFTNGTLEQLRELAGFLKKEGFQTTEAPGDVVRTAIAFLASIKANKEKKSE